MKSVTEEEFVEFIDRYPRPLHSIKDERLGEIKFYDHTRGVGIHGLAALCHPGLDSWQIGDEEDADDD